MIEGLKKQQWGNESRTIWSRKGERENQAIRRGKMEDDWRGQLGDWLTFSASKSVLRKRPGAREALDLQTSPHRL